MKLVLIIGALGLSIYCFGQDLPPDTQQKLEQLAETSDEQPDEALLLQVEALRKNPINLNTSDASELLQLPMLHSLLVDQFIRYRSLLGPLQDLHELQAVPGWSPELIRQVLPFVSLSDKEELKAVWKNLKDGSHMTQLRWTRTLQKSRGYEKDRENGFAGDPNSLLMRYIFRSKNVQAGWVAEKDEGETLLRKGRATPDFLAGHLFYKGKGLIKAIALGHFTANLGQGLAHWKGMAFGKSSDVLSIKRQGPILRPYASAGSFYFLKGLGLTMGKGRWQASLFAAGQRVDAHTGQDEWGDQYISSFSTSGLHRTNSEYAARRAAGQQVIGGQAGYQHQNFKIGANAVYHRFSLPVLKREEPYNRFGMQGNTLFNKSIDYSWTVKNTHLFGEAALDGQGHTAFVQGALISLHQHLDMAALFRSIDKAYTAISANPFTESRNFAGEQGLYLGLQWRLPARLRLSAYLDHFRFGWLRFRTDAPAAGQEYMVQLQYQPARETEAYLLFRSSEQLGNKNAGTPLNHLVPQKRNSLRLQFSKPISKGLLLRSRAEMVQYAGDSLSNGFLFFADIQYRKRAFINGDFRLAFFDANDFNSRIYAYEQDVLYGYSIPALFNRGIRAYLNLRLKLSKNATFWVKLAHTLYRDGSTIGSGLMTIEGNKKTDLRAQIICKW